MLDNIQNIEKLQETPFERFTGTFVPQKKLEKIGAGRRNDIAFGDNIRDSVELTIYDLRSQSAIYWKPLRDYRIDREGQILLPLYKRLQVADFQKNVDYGIRLGFRRKIIHPESLLDGIRGLPREERLNRLRKNLGASVGYKLFIDEISRGRREVRFRPKRIGQPRFDDAFRETFVGFFNQEPDVLRYAFNFGQGEVYPILNWTFDREAYPEFPFSVVAKLQNPIRDGVEAGDEFWIDETVFEPTFDKIVAPAEQEEGEDLVYLSAPNYNVDATRDKFSETGKKSWDDLLTDDVETTEQILSRFLENREQVDLNIDYSSFEEFVKFSSARERVLNFEYKYELLHRYNDSIEQKKNADNYNSNPQAQEKVEELKRKRTRLVEGLDGFEQYIYQKPELRDGSGNLLPPQNQAVQTFFSELEDEAKRYDDQNPDMLRKSLPEFFRADERNEDFTLFVDMMGQYFDEFWLYIKHVQYKSDRSEDIFDPESLSRDLTKFVAESFGYELYNGFDLQDLYQYAVDDADVRFPFADEAIDTNEEAGEVIQQQVWRRVLNNIPYISKTKGSLRSIRALMNTYGIPRIGLTIREFGGGSDTDSPGFYELEDISHALGFAQDGKVEVNWGGYQEIPESYEIRFRTEYKGSNNITLLEVPGVFTIDLKPVSGEDDVVRAVEVNAATGETLTVSTPIPVADGEWNVVSFNFDRSNRFAELQFGKIGKVGPYQFGDTGSSEGGVTWYESRSSTFGQSFASTYDTNTDDIVLGENFLGDVDFFRTWSRPVDQDTFRGHVLAPVRYDSDNSEFVKSMEFTDYDVGITRHLSVSLEFTEPADLTGGASLENEAPETDYVGSPQASGFPSATEEPWQFERIYRMNYMEPVKAGAVTLSSDKIRFSDTFIAGQLSPDEQREVGSFDRERRDSNKLGVYFNPLSGTNEDILASIGVEDVNKLLAYPDDRFKERYERLDVLNTKYWKKYPKPVDTHAYIRYVEQFNRAFFKQLKNIVPARTNLKRGLLMEPHLLERHKFKQLQVLKEEVSERTEISVLEDVEQFADYILESDDIGISDVVDPTGDYVLQDIKIPTDVVRNNYSYFGNRINETTYQTRQAPSLYPDGTYWDEDYEIDLWIEATGILNISRNAFDGDPDAGGTYIGSWDYESESADQFYATVDPALITNIYPDINKEAVRERTFAVDSSLDSDDNEKFNIGNVSFRRTYESFKYERRIPFPPGEIIFVNEIWESTDIFHTTFFQSFGTFNVYGDQGAATQEEAVANYDENDYSSQNAGGRFIFTQIGRIPTPDRPYRRYRHYIFNREFREAKKNQLYQGMVYDSSVAGEPAVELNDVEPERLIVSESDRDAGEGPIVDVE